MKGVELLKSHKPRDIREAIDLSRMIALYDMCGSEAFLRTCMPGHFTSSAWVMSPDRDKVLLMHHYKLDKWLQPGGHCDGDEDFRKVAIKETQEETGLVPIYSVSSRIFDLDIHLIPERKNEPRHYHYDVRFLFIADDRAPLLSNWESNELKWVSLDEVCKLTQEPSILRLLENSSDCVMSE